MPPDAVLQFGLSPIIPSLTVSPHPRADAPEWDLQGGSSSGNIRWLYSAQRADFEMRLAQQLAVLLGVPSRRVVSLGSSVDAAAGSVAAEVMLLDLSGDPTTETHPARAVQSRARESLMRCLRSTQGGAPPAPPPPPPSPPPTSPPGPKAPPFSLQPPPPLPDPDTTIQLVGIDPQGADGGAALSELPCPASVIGGQLLRIDDTTPPSPPMPPPPPEPPQPPSLPPLPPYIDCTYIPCEVIGDEEVAEIERRLAASPAAAGPRRQSRPASSRSAGTVLLCGLGVLALMGSRRQC